MSNDNKDNSDKNGNPKTWAEKIQNLSAEQAGLFFSDPSSQRINELTVKIEECEQKIRDYRSKDPHANSSFSLN